MGKLVVMNPVTPSVGLQTFVWNHAPVFAASSLNHAATGIVVTMDGEQDIVQMMTLGAVFDRLFQGGSSVAFPAVLWAIP